MSTSPCRETCPLCPLCLALAGAPARDVVLVRPYGSEEAEASVVLADVADASGSAALAGSFGCGRWSCPEGVLKGLSPGMLLLLLRAAVFADLVAAFRAGGDGPPGPVALARSALVAVGGGLAVWEAYPAVAEVLARAKACPALEEAARRAEASLRLATAAAAAAAAKELRASVEELEEAGRSLAAAGRALEKAEAGKPCPIRLKVSSSLLAEAAAPCPPAEEDFSAAEEGLSAPAPPPAEEGLGVAALERREAALRARAATLERRAAVLGAKAAALKRKAENEAWVAERNARLSAAHEVLLKEWVEESRAAKERAQKAFDATGEAAAASGRTARAAAAASEAAEAAAGRPGTAGGLSQGFVRLSPEA